ncbi:hypothetical protein RB195_014775 [Necator americanus]|uniref:Uncharacterized protein n=1 Tax=Necator americanus TaxID=51031 RepID=A0ABR1E1I7_NECAM
MGNLISKQDDREPRTVAEAKAEITEVLRKIQDHYAAINQMRLQDRKKWKFFNKRVEELEVVKARALKQERKRLRDQERAKERDELEAKTFSKEFVITPYGSSKEHIKYPNLQQQREQTSATETKSKEKVPSKPEFLATAEEITEPIDRSKSTASYKSPKPSIGTAKLDETKSSAHLLEEISDSGTGSPSSKHTAAKSVGSEELFVQIDKPSVPRRVIGPYPDAIIHRAKLVSVPLLLNEDESLSSEYTNVSVPSSSHRSHKELKKPNCPKPVIEPVTDKSEKRRRRKYVDYAPPINFPEEHYHYF